MTSAHQTPPPGVVYLAGWFGSTMLDRMLDQFDGWWSLGEVVQLWRSGVVADERRGCGLRFHECGVWGAIGEASFGGRDALDVDEVIGLRESVEPDRFLLQLAQPGMNEGFRRLRKYHTILAQLYDGVRRVTGASVIVDASKHVSTAVGFRSSHHGRRAW